jgi:hypothetical protein
MVPERGSVGGDRRSWHEMNRRLEWRKKGMLSWCQRFKVWVWFESVIGQKKFFVLLKKYVENKYYLKKNVFFIC